MPTLESFLGSVITEGARGYWFIEQDQTRDSLFVHQSHVKDHKVLHLNDRVRFNVVPNPRKPGEFMATDVEIIGHTIAIQRSAAVQS